MKLKYYLRGMGIGIILTAIVMGFALGGRRAAVSDAEIIKRARDLGMVEAKTGTLSESLKEEITVNENDAPSSGETLDKEGKEISKEEHQAVASADEPVSEVAKEEEKGESKESKSEAPSSEISGPETGSGSQIVETIVPPDEETAVSEEIDVASAGNQTDESEPVQSTTPPVSENTLQQNEAAITSEEPVQEPPAPKTEIVGKAVVIPGGSDSDTVAEILFNEGFVDNAVEFNRYLINSGKDRYIRSGTKTIPEGATYEQIAAIITTG